MFSKVTYIFLLLFVSIVLFSGDAAAVEQKATTAAIELRNRLVQKIDSLDIEKQRLKRNGENFEEIESQQTLYNDSLVALKQSIQSGLQQPVGQQPGQPSFSIRDIFNPQSSLDWVIFITSSIALLSFLFMISAIIRIRRKNSQMKKNAAQMKRTTIRQTPEAAGTGRDHSLQPPVFPEKNPLDQIKQKMQEASDYYGKTEPARPSTQRIRTIAIAEKENIEALVYEEYKKGVDIHEISKTFQISADHVSLLLKIRGITPSKK